jgi:hypothetical protein
MTDGFIVKPLQCSHCGNELPVMGQFVTFQCETCFHYFVLSPDGLKPITVYRAAPRLEHETDPAYLPFWVIEVSADEFRSMTNRVIDELRSISREILQTDFKMEESGLENLLIDNSELDTGLLKAQIVTEAAKAGRTPSSGEINYLLNRISGSKSFNIYVPAFLSLNTYAYLKVGRLFTSRQPSYTIERSAGLGRPVLCALQADEAVSLMDFIFFATLPESILGNADFIQRIHLEPAGQPRLVEFPFEVRGASLVSLIDELWISRKLVEQLSERETTATAGKS